jgi:DNA-binding ferritin-like protein
MEKLNELAAETIKEIDSLKSQAKELPDDEVKEKIKARMERLNARLETIRKLIEKTNAEKDG